MSAAVAEYTIAWADNPIELAKAVNNLIRDGWQPHGSVACDGGEFPHTKFYQALVREGDQ